MKKHLIILFTIITFVASGQFKKGTVSLGGSVSAWTNRASFSDINKDKSYNIAIQPAVGVLLNDNSAVGMELGYYYISNESKSDYNNSKSTRSTFFFAPFYRRYFALGNKAVFFIQANVNANLGKEHSSQFYSDSLSNYTNKSESDLTGYGASIRPGFIFFPHPKWGLEINVGSIQYSHTKRKQQGVAGTGKDDSFNIYYSILGFGLTHYFNR